MTSKYLDKTCAVQRINANAPVGWGGDQEDVYEDIATGVLCRYERVFSISPRTDTSDVSRFTVWLQPSIVFTPEERDHIVVDGKVLDVYEVASWTRFDGEVHNHELRCVEISSA
jgi:hypothetical protein